MIKSETIGKLAEALSKAQGHLLGAVKDADNPFYKSKYADLESVWEACRQELAKNGLSVTQLIGTSSVNGNPTMTTMLMHTSGEYIGDILEMNPVKKDPQGMGGAITYFRRYALAAIVGVHQTDDDGNESSLPSHNPKHQPSVSPPVTMKPKLKEQPPVVRMDEKVELLRDIGGELLAKQGLNRDEAIAHILSAAKKPDMGSVTIDDLKSIKQKLSAPSSTPQVKPTASATLNKNEDGAFSDFSYK